MTSRRTVSGGSLADVGSQSWSVNPAALKSIRFQSLMGVRDLIKRARGGVIVSGREHYFDQDQEMFESLGIDGSSATVIRCKPEFSDNELRIFLKTINAENAFVPSWLPNRPLMCQTIGTTSTQHIELRTVTWITELPAHRHYDCPINRECHHYQRRPAFILETAIHRRRWGANQPA